MRTLALPEGLLSPAIVTNVADDDAMFDGRGDHYVSVGLSAMRLVRRALRGISAPERILDMPCGHGRVTRMLRAYYPSAGITVCDLDSSGVDFTAQHFDARGVYSQEDFREVDLGERYDLIWVGSLITHLSEQQTRRFLDFAVRHLTPEGTLVITSHGFFVGERLLSYNYGLTDAAARGLLADTQIRGYGYRNYPGGDGYGISLVRRSWFEDLFADGKLRLDSYEERGWDDHQDVLVVRPRPTTAAPGGYLDRLRRKLGGSKEPTLQPLYDTGSVAPLPVVDQETIDQGTVTGFDEAWYLAFDPNVAAAVAQGLHASGLDHYCQYGWREARPFCDQSLTYDGRPRRAALLALAGQKPDDEDRKSRINRVWSADIDEQAESDGWYWMAHPHVMARLNTLVSGDPTVDAYRRLANLLQERGWQLPIKRSLSLGCGFGGLERDLASRGLIGRIDGYDLAENAIVEARRQAKTFGLSNLYYHVADLETADLPSGKTDVVFAHQSVHHVERLEQMFAKVARALRPGGIFHLHEYVGPIRFQWTDAQIELVNEFLDSLPEPLRRLPSGKRKPPQARATVEAMIAADPSEAIRSSDIEAVLAEHFTIIETRRLGGTLVHLALGDIAQNFLPGNPDHQATLERLFALEDKAMHDGIISSDFTVLTALKA